MPSNLGLRFRAAGLIVRHPPSASTTLSFSLLRTSPLSWLWTACLPSLFRGSYSLCLGSALIAHILSSGSSYSSTYSRRALHGLCSASKLFCCAATTFFFLSSMRHVASSSSSSLLRKASTLSPSLSLSLSSLFSSVADFSSISYRSASLLALSLPLFVHVIFYSFTSASSTLKSAETSIHILLGFMCSQVSTELCLPHCIALGLCSYSTQGPLEACSIVCFLRFHAFITLGHCDLTGIPITSSGASTQNIFLEPLPLLPPGVCGADPLGHSVVNEGTVYGTHTHSTR